MSTQKVRDNLEKIESHAKNYESLALRYDPQYENSLKAIPIIEKFIKDNGLIIYGGTAIDYALRLHGDAIYPDEALDIPDLDFYSPNNVKHSYELALTLYKAGFTSARSIVATHVQTMRVDIGDNHFLADISYVPPTVFKKLPTIDYKGFKVIHPFFQKIDLHSSLTFPFDNPPREVVFARWKKDIKRFNLLHKYYPTKYYERTDVPLDTIKIPVACRKIPLNGFAAYAVIVVALEELLGEAKPKNPKYIRANITVDKSYITFDTLNSRVDLVHFNTEEMVKILNLRDITKYAPYIHLIPSIVAGKMYGKSEAGDVVNSYVWSSEDQYVSIHRVDVNDTAITIVGVQYLLKYFLTQAHISEDEKHRNLYYKYYESILEIINLAEKRLVDFAQRTMTSDDYKKLLENSPFFPTVKVFGKSNESSSYKIQYARSLADMDSNNKLPSLPFNYYPHRGNPPKEFDYETSEFFTMDGRVKK